MFLFLILRKKIDISLCGGLFCPWFLSELDRIQTEKQWQKTKLLDVEPKLIINETGHVTSRTLYYVLFTSMSCTAYVAEVVDRRCSIK